MKALLYRDFTRNISPFTYIISCLGIMLLIPDWPYFIAMMYFFVCVPWIYTTARIQKDTEYLAMMPVTRKDIVQSRIIAVVILECIQLLIAGIFAYINISIYTSNSFLDPTFSFFGLVLIMYGLYNAIFFPLYYKRYQGLFFPTFLSTMIAVGFGFFIECMNVLFPLVSAIIDNPSLLPANLIILIVGIFIFVLLTYIAYIQSVKFFKEVDL